MRNMILGIDASNIRGGGGVTHLVELFRAADPAAYGFSQVIVWGGHETLSRTESRPWLVKSHQAMLDKGFLYRLFWQRFRLSNLARVANCDLLFVPGGSYAGDFGPVVAMSQNLLPFEWSELRRYGWSWMTLRILMLRRLQSRTFGRAQGIIFLTRYARDVIMQAIKLTSGKTRIIPHGIDNRFVHPPRTQLDISQYSADRPFQILYVSIIDMYKHQWHVVEAVAQLRTSGMPVALDLVGPAYAPAMERLKDSLRRVDPGAHFIRYRNAVPYEELHRFYAAADINVFASSCENMPNILLEGMASGLPIACSNRGPMPEVLGDAGVYFNPEQPSEIAAAIRTLIVSPKLRLEKAQVAFRRGQAFSWDRCSRDTFEFLAEVAHGASTAKNARA